MIEDLLPEEKRKLHELDEELAALERGTGKMKPCDFQVALNEMEFHLAELDKMIKNESKSRREDFRRRLHRLKTNHTHLKSSFENFMKRKDLNSFESQKRELFNAVNTDAGPGGYNNVNDMALDMAESGSLDRSGRMLDEYIAAGRDTLSELVMQKDRLKSVQRKVFDMMNYLGISNSIMKAVEKREIVDKWLVYIGMILIMFLIALLWWFGYISR